MGLEARTKQETKVAEAKAALADNNGLSAINLLERAIRMQPRDSELWVALAQAHLANNNIGAATQHARKAIALAGNEPALQRNAWLALADIREAEGMTTEARSIRRRYNRIGS